MYWQVWTEKQLEYCITDKYERTNKSKTGSNLKISYIFVFPFCYKCHYPKVKYPLVDTILLSRRYQGSSTLIRDLVKLLNRTGEPNLLFVLCACANATAWLIYRTAQSQQTRSLTSRLPWNPQAYKAESLWINHEADVMFGRDNDEFCYFPHLFIHITCHATDPGWQ